MSQWPEPESTHPRLVLLTLDFVPAVGGVQEYLYEIGQRLAKSYSVTVVTSAGGPLPEPTPLQRVLVPSATTWAFWRQLRRIRPARVLIGHAHPRLLLAAAVYDQYSAIAYGNDFLAAQKRWHRPLFNRLLARAAPLITISQASAARLQRLGLPAPAIVRPGADPERFTPGPGRMDDRQPTLLTIGRLVPRKGIDTVLCALPALLAEFPRLRYLVGGDGPDRPRLEKLAQALGVHAAVRFLGSVAPVALSALYRQADIFIMVTREEEAGNSVEGFGIVYLEAGACSLPVIAGCSGGATEAVRHGETGYLVDPNDPEALSKTVLTLLQNRELRQQMGQNGRRWVETEMNWDRAAQQFLQVLAQK